MNPWLLPEPPYWKSLVDLALSEDCGLGDVTSPCLDPELSVEWYIEAQAGGVLCGIGIAQYLVGNTNLRVLCKDGDEVKPGTTVIEGSTNARHLLAVERTALNFLMHLSGVSTITSHFVAAVQGTRAKIIDTRKTLPGLRALEKYAVRCGGGHNHRMGLYDGAMIKDNHIKSSGSISEAVRRIRETSSHMIKIEVECESEDQVKEAIEVGTDIVMLDNMSPESMKLITDRYHKQCLFEASGGITISSVRKVAESGVDFISVGALTHSAPSLALHLEVR